MGKEDLPHIVICGVCASGKSVLAERLSDHGVRATEIAQEHSSVRDLWRHPRGDFLVVLLASYETIKSRRRVSWGPSRVEKQLADFADALENADLVIDTDPLSIDEVTALVIEKVGTSAGNTVVDEDSHGKRGQRAPKNNCVP